MKMLAMELLTLTIQPFQYILTYKLSQDHLELLFSCIRALNGHCTNPMVRQFISAIKRILLRASILASNNGNCVVFETDESPSIFALKSTRCSEKEPEDIEEIPEHLLAVDMSESHSVYKMNILANIGGFICRTMRKTVSCDVCCDALITTEKSGEAYGLIRENDNSPLIYPSEVLSVLSVAENVFKQYHINGLQAISTEKMRSQMKARTMAELYDTNIFQSLKAHDIQNHDALEDMHSTQLIKTIAHKYFDMRLFRYQQQYNDDVIHQGKVGMRQKMNKTVIFNGL